MPPEALQEATAQSLGVEELTDDDEEFAELPKFAVSHEEWLRVRVGKLSKPQKLFVSLKQARRARPA